MRRVILLLFIYLMTPGAGLADGRDVFRGVLQGVLGEIDRQQHRDGERQRRRTTAEIQACFQGDERACSAALQSPWLNADGRRAISEQLRAIAEQRAAADRAHKTFIADWGRCRDAGDVAACEAALRYPNLLGGDRDHLLTWRQAALDRIRAEERRIAERRAAERLAEQAAQAMPVVVVPVAAPIVTASIEPLPKVAVSKPGPAMIGFVALCGVAALIAVWVGTTSAARTTPIEAEAEPLTTSGSAAASTDAGTLPLTGHFPTDVRRVLAG